jgi:hypothetical protein
MGCQGIAPSGAVSAALLGKGGGNCAYLPMVATLTRHIGNKCWVLHCPRLPVKLLGLMDFMRLSSMKAAHAAVAWCRVQEIRVKPGSGLSGIMAPRCAASRLPAPPQENKENPQKGYRILRPRPALARLTPCPSFGKVQASTAIGFTGFAESAGRTNDGRMLAMEA